jgi:hypothetical protein
MNRTTDHAVEQYRRQLNAWVEGMAVDDNSAVYPDAAPTSTPTDVDLFTEGNLAKRFEVLDFQMAFLRPAFPDFDDLAVDFITTEPLPAYETGSVSGEAFLRWLEETLELTPVQRDYIACRRGRYQVEDIARADRLAHIRFQERWSVAGVLAKHLGRDGRLRIQLNPIRAWARFETDEFLEGQAEPPADVLFFAVRSSIHTAVLDAPMPVLLEGLDGKDGVTLLEWARRVELAASDDLVSLARDLAEMGLVAFN